LAFILNIGSFSFFLNLFFFWLEKKIFHIEANKNLDVAEHGDEIKNHFFSNPFLVKNTLKIGKNCGLKS